MASHKGGIRELALVVSGFAALTAALTYPLALQLASITYGLENGDSRWSIWVVNWVAHALTTDPLNVFHANIFHPHRWTLAYSEPNLGAGALAIPALWLTGSPFAAHNSVVLISFVVSGAGCYYLTRYLTHDRRAAVAAAVSFAYAPYVFAHLPHVQLLMTAGLPLSLLALHRMMDRPDLRRGAMLGLALALQALLCAYYGVFAKLMVGYGFVFLMVRRRLWRDRQVWLALGAAVAIAALVAVPLFIPYAMLNRESGFGRTLGQATFVADWRAYFASAAYFHSWMLPLLRRWPEVLFPGFIALAFGLFALVPGWKAGGRLRELVTLYGSLAALAFWLSFGSSAGLYSLFYYTVPAFSFLRAPARFGLLVVLALSVLSSIGIARLLAQRRRSGWIAAAVIAVAVGESVVPIAFDRVPPVEPAHQMLAQLPHGALIELPVYSRRAAFARTWYMLGSTAHWKPLVNGYSDYTPPDFTKSLGHLGGFPSRESFEILERSQVRYALFHLDLFSPDSLRQDVIDRLEHFDKHLHLLWKDEHTRLYEIAGYP